MRDDMEILSGGDFEDFLDGCVVEDAFGVPQGTHDKAGIAFSVIDKGLLYVFM